MEVHDTPSRAPKAVSTTPGGRPPRSPCAGDHTKAAIVPGSRQAVRPADFSSRSQCAPVQTLGIRFHVVGFAPLSPRRGHRANVPLAQDRRSATATDVPLEQRAGARSRTVPCACSASIPPVPSRTPSRPAIPLPMPRPTLAQWAKFGLAGRRHAARGSGAQREQQPAARQEEERQRGHRRPLAAG